jgi:hypothetical protein
MSLMEFVKLLLSDDVARAHFAADPDDSLAHHGLSDLSPADVRDAVGHVQDTLTVDWARAYGSGSAAVHASPRESVAAPSPPDWWTADEPDPVAEPDDAPPHHVAADVDEALFDPPDLHFGH